MVDSGLQTPIRKADVSATADSDSGVLVVGAGLAGCEAAWQLAKRGIHVRLYEMRPVKPTEVHKTDSLAEMVCSNSLRSDGLDNATELDDGDPVELGASYAALRQRYPSLRVLGGCCGTDHRHVATIGDACVTPLATSAA